MSDSYKNLIRTDLKQYWGTKVTSMSEGSPHAMRRFGWICCCVVVTVSLRCCWSFPARYAVIWGHFSCSKSLTISTRTWRSMTVFMDFVVALLLRYCCIVVALLLKLPRPLCGDLTTLILLEFLDRKHSNITFPDRVCGFCCCVVVALLLRCCCVVVGAPPPVCEDLVTFLLLN